jgi:hypothetical protein
MFGAFATLWALRRGGDSAQVVQTEYTIDETELKYKREWEQCNHFIIPPNPSLSNRNCFFVCPL